MVAELGSACMAAVRKVKNEWAADKESLLQDVTTMVYIHPQGSWYVFGAPPRRHPNAVSEMVF